MGELFLYLGKSGLCLSLLLLFFVIFLQKETFLKLNRWILVANILLALTLPLLETPSWFSNIVLTKTEISESKPEFVEVAPTLDNKNITPMSKKNPIKKLNWEAIIFLIYLIGFFIFLLRFLAQLFSIFLLIIFNKKEQKGKIFFIYPRGILAPFSFFSFLFIDRNAYDSSTFQQIIAHETTHIQQRHSWDILLSELLIIIQWFNPFAWWHRKLVETNLEYLVDQNLLKNGVDKKTYQYNLLQIAVPNYPYSLATNYNSSLLKKRIMMMQQKKSSTAQSWKYFLLAPVILVIWMAFGSPHSKDIDTPFISIITADASEEDILKTQEVYRKMGETLVVNELKFDDNDRLSSLNITSISGDKGECTSSMDGFESYNHLIYERSSRKFGCGSFLSAKNFEMIGDTKNWDFIFINGQRPTRNKIDQLIMNTERWRAVMKEKIKNTNPKSVGTTTYVNLTEEKKNIVKENILSAKTTTIYYLDGMKTDKSIDDFDYKNIRSVKLNHKWINYYDNKGDLLERLTDTLTVEIVSQ